MAIAVAAIALCVLPGCTSGSSPMQADGDAQAKMFAQDKARYDPNVGKNFWVRTAVRLCPQPNSLALGCNIIGAPTRLAIDRIEEGIQEAGGRTFPIGIAYCHGTLDDGRAGYVMCSELMAEATDIDPVAAAAECKRKGAPRVGMTYKQVEATCWGKPDHVNRSETAGAISDQYVYGDDRYVYLRNGIVTSIQTSGTVH
jgi:hypothetical protein